MSDVPPASPAADPVADILAEIDVADARDAIEERGHQIGLRLISLYEAGFAAPLDALVGPWIAAWERFATALRTGCDADVAEALRLAAEIVAEMQAVRDRWDRIHSDWYTTEAEPWSRDSVACGLGKQYAPDYLPLATSQTHVWCEPLRRHPSGPAAIPNMICDHHQFRTVVAKFYDYPGRAARLVYVALERPESAEVITTRLRPNGERLAGMSLAFAASILPAPAVLTRLVELAGSEQAVHDVRQLMWVVPDYLCRAARIELDERFSERDLVSSQQAESAPVDSLVGAQIQSHERSHVVGTANATATFNRIEAAGTVTKEGSKSPPSQTRQDDIIAAIRTAGMPLQAAEIKDALRIKAKYSSLPRDLSWMRDHCKLTHHKGMGYWLADSPPPDAV